MIASPKLLIVTADDFGISHGVNRGVMEAHREGILTSASLMVDRPAAEEAADLGRQCPGLSVGLHLELDPRHLDDVPSELERQLARFVALVGALPTHVDSHHDIHREPAVLPHVRAWARGVAAPVRGFSDVHHLSKFYGQWDGEMHLEQISVEGLLRLLDEHLPAGPQVTELTCHPGYADPGLGSSYAGEREAELRTLCDPRVPRALHARRICLISFRTLQQASA